MNILERIVRSTKEIMVEPQSVTGDWLVIYLGVMRQFVETDSISPVGALPMGDPDENEPEDDLDEFSQAYADTYAHIIDDIALQAVKRKPDTSRFYATHSFSVTEPEDEDDELIFTETLHTFIDTLVDLVDEFGSFSTGALKLTSDLLTYAYHEVQDSLELTDDDLICLDDDVQRNNEVNGTDYIRAEPEVLQQRYTASLNLVTQFLMNIYELPPIQNWRRTGPKIN